MYEEKYCEAGQILKAHQQELIQALWQMVETCLNIQTSEFGRLQRLVYNLVDRFFVSFLEGNLSNITSLGEELAQVGATPTFLTCIDEAMRNFCIVHLQDDLLIVGLEATADFHNHLVREYIQTTQGLLELQTISREDKIRLKSLLTEREIIVLENLVKGKRNKQIAEEMGVSERTVANYLKQARMKLGTHSRSDTILTVARLLDL
jgi:DNA-binding CsgD family transcriptional regulator